MKNIFTLVFFTWLLNFLPGYAQWSTTAPTVVCSNGSYWNRSVTMISDGQGGYIMAWQDIRAGSLPNDPDFSDIYIQRLNADGVPQWTANGLKVCGAAHEQNNPILALCKTSSNQTRVMVVWKDYRTVVNNSTVTKIYAQSYDLSGTAQWAVDGVQVADCNGFSAIAPAGIATASQDRVVFAWSKPTSTTSSLYVQAINPDNGATLYGGDGTLLGSGIISLKMKVGQAEGSADMHVVWSAYTTEGGYSENIYAQRIVPATGAKQWANPTKVCAAERDQVDIQIEGDIIVWRDERVYTVSNSNREIFAQRLNANGTVAWAANGINVSNESGSQLYPKIASAGTNSVWVTWADDALSNKDSSFVTLQKINSDGSLAFGMQGLKLISNKNSRSQGMVVSQDDGSVLVLVRSNTTGSMYRAHKISSAGQKLWGPIGQPVGGLTESSIEDPVDIEGVPLTGGGAVFSIAEYQAIWALRAKICDTPPAAPTVVSPYRKCAPGEYAIVLKASGCPSGVVRWYEAPDGFQFLGTASAPYSYQNTIYGRDTTAYVYAECVVDGCASTTAMTPAHIQIAESSYTSAQLPNYPLLVTDPPAVVLSQSTITAQNKVEPPANVLYEATQAVNLTPGFQANTGAVFRAEVKTCVNVN